VQAIARALQRNIAERQIVEGGSTITQQVAKLLLNRQAPQRRRGWRAKVYEAVLALRLEHRLQKREILALYLNLAAYGNQTAGVERASQTYFGVESRMLTAAQASSGVIAFSSTASAATSDPPTVTSGDRPASRKGSSAATA